LSEEGLRIETEDLKNSMKRSNVQLVFNHVPEYALDIFP
jgi:hypothetical protein